MPTSDDQRRPTMSDLPEIPPRWRERYRQFELPEWIGWIALSRSGESFQFPDSSPQSLFAHDNVLKWYKTERNHLAEVKWPSPSADMPDNVPDNAPDSVVVKSYRPGSRRHALRLRFGVPRSIRHWNNAWILRTKGINTPLPVMLALRKNGNGQGLLAVETVPEHCTIRNVYPPQHEDETTLSIGRHVIGADRFAVICGHYVRELHDQEIVHRDLSGGNVLIPEQWDGTDLDLKKQFVLVDINRVRQIPQQKLGINLRIQDLERLDIPERYLHDYYFAYAGQDAGLQKQWHKFLKYRRSYRRIRETRNPLLRGLLKTFTYWPRTG